MQAITLEVILRVVFGVAEGPRLERLRGVLTDVLEETASPFAQLIGLATRRFGGRGPWAKFEAPARRRSTSCSTPRSPSTAPTATSRSATTSSRC